MLPLPCYGIDYRWLNPVSGDWNTASNWDPAGIPGPGDSVTIDLDGTYTVTVSESTTVHTLLLGAPSGTQTLQIDNQFELESTGSVGSNGAVTHNHPSEWRGAGMLTVTGIYYWHGGTQRGPGETRVLASGRLELVGSAVKTLTAGRRLENWGELRWSGTGNLQADSATIDNQLGGLFDIQIDALFDTYCCGSVTINNDGTIRKSGGGGMMTIEPTLHDNGDLEVMSGTLRLTGGGTCSGGGIYVAGGRQLTLGGGTTTLSGASMTGSGTIRLESGTLEVTGTRAPGRTPDSCQTTIDHAGGTLDGSGTLEMHGTYNWQSGHIIGGVTLHLMPTATMNITTAPAKNLTDGSTIRNAGTVNWSAALIQGNDGATIDNLSGALFDIQDDLTFDSVCCGSAATLANAGTVRKSAGSGNAVLDLIFDNDGTLEVQSGTVQLYKGGTSSGEYSIDAGQRLEFNSGTHTLAGATISGDGEAALEGATLTMAPTRALSTVTGNLSISSGTLTGGGTLTVSGDLIWTAGNISGLGLLELTPTSSFSIEGSAARNFLAGSTIENSGTMTWSGSGTIQTNEGAMIRNRPGGQFTMTGTGDLTQVCCGDQPIVRNEGTFTKQTASTPTIHAAFDNDGNVHIEEGTLFLYGGGNSNGTFTVDSGATLAFQVGTFSMDGATLSGDGVYDLKGSATLETGLARAASSMSGNLHHQSNASLTGGTLTVSGDYTWSGGVITNLDLLQITDTGTLTIEGTAIKHLQAGAAIGVAGEASWTGSGPVQLQNGATITVQSGGLLEADSTSNMSLVCCGDMPSLINHGTFDVAPTANLVVNVRFDNHGEVDVEGSVSFYQGGSADGIFDTVTGSFTEFIGSETFTWDGAEVQGPGLILFTGGTIDIIGDSTVTSGAEMAQIGGTLTGTADMIVDGAYVWQNGSMSGTGRTHIGTGATMEIDTTNTKLLSKRTLYNDGSMLVVGSGTIQLQDGAIIDNRGLVDLQTNLGIQTACCGDPPSIVNSGEFRLSGGGGTSGISIPFTNEGTLSLRSGQLQLSDSFTQTAGATILDGGILNASLTLDFDAGLLAGYGTITGSLEHNEMLWPGLSAATLAVTGNLTLEEDAHVLLEIGGYVAGSDHDYLNVGGQLGFDGILRTEIIDPFVPVLGDSFTVIDHGGHSGGFSHYSGLEMDNGLRFVPVYDTNALVLETECYPTIQINTLTICDIGNPFPVEVVAQCGPAPTYDWDILTMPPEGGFFDDETARTPMLTALGLGPFSLEVDVIDNLAVTRTATKTVYAIDPDVDGDPGISSEDWGFFQSHWRDLATTQPQLDVNQAGEKIDILDLIIARPCYP